MLSNLLTENPEVFECELDKLTNSELLKDILNLFKIKAWDSLLLDEITKIDKGNKTYSFAVNFIVDSAQQSLRLSNQISFDDFLDLELVVCSRNWLLRGFQEEDSELVEVNSHNKLNLHLVEECFQVSNLKSWHSLLL